MYGKLLEVENVAPVGHGYDMLYWARLGLRRQEQEIDFDLPKEKNQYWMIETGYKISILDEFEHTLPENRYGI